MTDDKHDQAIGLTEKALDSLVQGDGKTADKLIAQAKKLDPTAPEEIIHDLDEDAART